MASVLLLHLYSLWVVSVCHKSLGVTNCISKPITIKLPYLNFGKNELMTMWQSNGKTTNTIFFDIWRIHIVHLTFTVVHFDSCILFKNGNHKHVTQVVTVFFGSVSCYHEPISGVFTYINISICTFPALWNGLCWLMPRVMNPGESSHCLVLTY